MTLRLEQLTLAELRDLSRQHGLPDTYNAEQMRHALRTTLTPETRQNGPQRL